MSHLHGGVSPAASSPGESFDSRAVFERAAIGVMQRSPQGRIVYVNPAARHILGLAAEDEAPGHTLASRWQLVHENGSRFTEEDGPAERAAQTGKPVEGVTIGLTALGQETRWLLVDAYPEALPGALPPYKVLVTIQDVTQRRLAATNAQRWERMFRQTELAFAIADIRTNTFADVNETFARQRGYTREELVGRPIVDVFAPDARELMRERFADIDDKRHLVFESAHVRKDGSRMPVLVEASTILDATGRAVSRVAYVLDISERRRAEEQLAASRAVLEAALESMTDSVYISDASGNYVIGNEAFARFHRFPARAEAIKTLGEYPQFLEVWLEDGTLVPIEQWPVALALRGESVAGAEYVMRRADTGERWYASYSFGPVHDASGAIIGTVVVGRDISDRKRIEAELRQRNEELTRFTYAVSHDLKSPLVTIRTFLGYLENDVDRGDGERVRADLGYMKHAADRMARMLDELLELSRVGRLVNAAETVTLQALVDEAARLVAGAITAKGVTLQLSAPPVLVTGDRTRLVELFQNLIDNAVKFMGTQRAPRVDIGVDTTRAPFVFHVRDNGSGIDRRHMSKLFGLFEKLDPHSDGSGIGLALARRIVDVHGGRIWAESDGEGHGTSFYFTLSDARLLR